MNVQVSHVVVHEPAQVREIIAEAIRIADENGGAGHRWEPIFMQACQLLGQRFTFAAQQQPIPLDLGTLTNARGRH